jgi:hypothetical protein
MSSVVPGVQACAGTWPRGSRMPGRRQSTAWDTDSSLPDCPATSAGSSSTTRIRGSPLIEPRNQADTAVMPAAEIRKPLPSAVQVTPVTADSQRNGPTPVAVP